MFNTRLKQEIAYLESQNRKLQERYDLVNKLLQERQDEVVALQRQFNDIPSIEEIDYVDIVSRAKESLRDAVGDNLDFIKESTIDELVDSFITYFERALDIEE